MQELEPGGRNSPLRGGGEGGERGPGPRRPLPPRPRGGTGTAAPGSLARGTPGGLDASEAQAGLPGRASLRVLGPPAAHNARGPGCGHRRAAPEVPSAARTPTWKTSSGAADLAAAAAGGCRRPRRSGGREGRPGSGGAGAACVDPRSPAPTAAVTAVLRLQWSAAPQPLLSHGRGTLEGRCSGLPAPGCRRLAGWLGWSRTAAVGDPAACGTCWTPSPRCPESHGLGAPSLRGAESHCLGSLPARPPWEHPWCPEITAVEPLTGHPWA